VALVCASGAGKKTFFQLLLMRFYYDPHARRRADRWGSICRACRSARGCAKRIDYAAGSCDLLLRCVWENIVFGSLGRYRAGEPRRAAAELRRISAGVPLIPCHGGGFGHFLAIQVCALGRATSAPCRAPAPFFATRRSCCSTRRRRGSNAEASILLPRAARALSCVPHHDCHRPIAWRLCSGPTDHRQ